MSFKYSTSQINKAGDTLSGRTNELDAATAWGILDYWRSIHQTPLHYICMNLARHATRIDKNAFVARRLKRSPSIFSKLRREEKLTLRKMQDLGGCRAIVVDLDSANRLSDSFERSTQNHILERKKDYIKNPKASGYRGIHLIYKFQSKDEGNLEFNELRVEIQIRSIPQHVWATAVEIVGTITKQSLKSSQGAKNWLRFFQCMSEGISIVEHKGKLNDGLLRELLKLEKKLDVRTKLSAYRMAMKHVNRDNNANYYVMEIEGTTLTIHGFKDKDKANEAYIEAEKRLMNVLGADAVLVGTKSFHELKRAYPNYFGDSEKFIKILNGFLMQAQKKASLLNKLMARFS